MNDRQLFHTRLPKEATIYWLRCLVEPWYGKSQRENLQSATAPQHFLMILLEIYRSKVSDAKNAKIV